MVLIYYIIYFNCSTLQSVLKFFSFLGISPPPPLCSPFFPYFLSCWRYLPPVYVTYQHIPVLPTRFLLRIFIVYIIVNNKPTNYKIQQQQHTTSGVNTNIPLTGVNKNQYRTICGGGGNKKKKQSRPPWQIQCE